MITSATNYDELINMILFSRPNEKIDGEYMEHHHILPKCLGGSDSKNNLIFSQRAIFVVVDTQSKSVAMEREKHIEVAIGVGLPRRKYAY